MFLFLPPAVKLLNYMEVLKSSFFRVVLLIVLTIIITMAITGVTVNFLIERGERKNGTTKAMEMGEVESAISALSIVIAGVLILILAIFIRNFIAYI